MRGNDSKVFLEMGLANSSRLTSSSAFYSLMGGLFLSTPTDISFPLSDLYILKK